MRPGVVLHTSNRLEDLLGTLAALLAEEPLAPLQNETIVVPGQGLARWVQLQLAERAGIAGGLELPFPGAFLRRLQRAADPALADPFETGVLRWRLWRLLGDVELARELGAATRYCSDDPDGRKRFQLCQRLSTCLDDYQLYRDDLLLRAAAGDDLADLGPHGGWQARLWRALLRDAGWTPPVASTRAKGRDAGTGLPFPGLGAAAGGTTGAPHRLQYLRELLDDAPRARAVLPSRLSVFGAGTLGPAFLDLLGRIGAHVPVHLFVPQPTAEFTGDQRGTSDDPGNQLGNRLGQEAREFQRLLVDFGEKYPVREVAPAPAADPPPDCLLHCLQRDIHLDRDRGPGGDEPPFLLRADDDSLRVHDCHSPQRELEVVRDQILAAFAADRSLAPHEVLVLVPDIETYAPYAHAVFGPVREFVPFHVADRSPAHERPLCASVFAVLELARDRLHVHDVLHLLEEPAVQRRFGLSARDLPMLRHRCERAGIRWGLDGEWRERTFRVPAFDANAWLPGLDRLLLGAATGPEDDLVLGILPVGAATAGRDEQLARFVQFAHTLFGHLHELQRLHAPAVWADLLDALLADFYRPATADDEQAIADLQRATALLRAQARGARTTEPIAPIVLHDWLAEMLQQATGARGFLAGAVTIAAMLPMRTVPVRQLFLCGLADQTFPRRDQPSAFDLIAKVRRTGDRSVRLDDRQMFLDALLAARDRLHITFVGHSQKDDSECAPSVVLAELLDTIDRGCEPPAGFATSSAAVTVRHPLQPWSRRYRDGEDARLFTYAAGTAPAAAKGFADEPAFVDAAVLAGDDGAADLPLDTLLAFWRHPSRYFLQRLGIRLRKDDDNDRDTEPFVLDNLERWRLEEDMVKQALRGGAPRDPLALAHASGRLPVGGLGAMAYTASQDRVGSFLHELRQHGLPRPRSLDVMVGDLRVHGEVAEFCAEALVLARPAKVKAKDRLKAFVLHAFTALARHRGHADLPASTWVIGHGRPWHCKPLDGPTAESHCRLLIDGYRAGLAAPLPFFENSSTAYGEALAKGKGEVAAMQAAKRTWSGDSTEHAYGYDATDHAVALCTRGRDVLQEPGFATWAAAIWGAIAETMKEDR